MTIEIGGKDYQIEFTFEASMYHECTQQVIEFIANSAMLSEQDKNVDTMKDMIKEMTNIPSITLTMFYAGLLEHHGIEGDGTVPDKQTAKALMKQYMAEHKGTQGDNAYDILNMLLTQMGEDGFFKQIGLTQMMESESQTPRPNRATRRASGK